MCQKKKARARGAGGKARKGAGSTAFFSKGEEGKKALKKRREGYGHRVPCFDVWLDERKKRKHRQGGPGGEEKKKSHAQVCSLPLLLWPDRHILGEKKKKKKKKKCQRTREKRKKEK